MVLESWSISGRAGRRLIAVLGGLYVVAGLGMPFSPFSHDWTAGIVSIFLLLVVGPGLILLYASYRLPRTEVRPDLFGSVAKWCLSGIVVMLAIVALIALLIDLMRPGNILILTALASVSGLGMGFTDARAETRALNAEEQRLEAERYSKELKRYETIVETINDGIFVIDEDDRFTLVNETYAEMVGYDREELLGTHTSLVVEKGIDDLPIDAQRELLRDRGGKKTYDAVLKTSSEELLEVEATVGGLPEGENARHDLAGVVRDVTERNEREQQLERQNKRLDSFASMIAHELRNPLMIGQMYCNELPAEAAPLAVEYITESFDRIEDIIDVLLVITQGHEAIPESTPVELAAVAESAWTKVESSNASLDVLIDATISADETYLEHLLRNLFENAIEHGGTDVTVTVGELSTGFYVADNGIGISAEDKETVFEMGYTTASDYGGMGLGLAFVRELSDVYGWTCSLTDSETGGAQFEFSDVTKTAAAKNE
ncbi:MULTISPECIES: ATP-binding protein [unclassified Haladaptatus]|uniref:ATP-binding protein n=1 Tax=unclassified Haladaptatus TaxID=2622732 RepID=UPI00209C57B6|nr:MULTISPECIES: ATP-binding protein [unclassified Haladaptatus]MCO8242548.1 PAS domain S-box protein [Haladaptatus sp. AB643]MCO8252305.1 PAS domain S-box protein [Haladaptatus sp. AB618]